MCVQCFYGELEGMLIVHDCRSTIVTLGVVTLYHLHRVWEGGSKAVLPPRDGSAWNLIQFAFWSILIIALYCKLKFEVLSELQCIAPYFNYCLLPKPKAWVPSNSTGILNFLRIQWYNRMQVIICQRTHLKKINHFHGKETELLS